MWPLIQKELKLRVKERRTYMFLLVMPILVILLIGSGVHGLGLSQIIPGYTVMFAFFIITVMAQAFFKDRESGMLSRLTSTPLKKYEYMVGMWLPNFFVVLIQVTVIYAFGHYYFRFPLGNFPALIAVTLMMAYVSTALGLLLTFISDNQQMVMVLVQITVLGGAALGGAWFPTDILPQSIQRISMIFPQYWIQKSYVAIFGKGANLGDVAGNLGVLIVLGLVFFYTCLSEV